MPISTFTGPYPLYYLTDPRTGERYINPNYVDELNKCVSAVRAHLKK